MTRKLVLLSAMALAVALVGCRVQKVKAGGNASKAAQDTAAVSVYIPCGMVLPFNAVIEQFEKTAGERVRAKYDNSNVLVRLIADKGERPDIIVAPGVREIQYLEQKGLVDPASKRYFGSYTVILIVPKGNPAGIHSLADLAKPEVKSIAVGDPKINSVGYYAKESLTHLGLYDKVKDKILPTEHPVDAYKLVSQGRVQAAISYRTCPMESNPEKLQASKVEIVAEFPRDSYQAAAVTAAVLKDAPHKKEAQQFIEYLLGTEAQKMLAQNGLPNERGIDYASFRPSLGSGEASSTQPGR